MSAGYSRREPGEEANKNAPNEECPEPELHTPREYDQIANSARLTLSKALKLTSASTLKELNQRLCACQAEVNRLIASLVDCIDFGAVEDPIKYLDEQLTALLPRTGKFTPIIRHYFSERCLALFLKREKLGYFGNGKPIIEYIDLGNEGEGDVLSATENAVADLLEQLRDCENPMLPSPERDALVAAMVNDMIADGIDDPQAYILFMLSEYWPNLKRETLPRVAQLLSRLCLKEYLSRPAEGSNDATEEAVTLLAPESCTAQRA